MDDWRGLLNRYTYADRTPILDRRRHSVAGSSRTDRDIINEMVLWKLNRSVEIDDLTLTMLAELPRRVATPEAARGSALVSECLERLLQNGGRGFRLPMASTILHLYCPEMFPIVDERAYRQCGFNDWNPRGGPDLYLKYLGACIDLSKRHGIPMTEIDKVLYQKDIEQGNRLVGAR